MIWRNAFGCSQKQSSIIALDCFCGFLGYGSPNLKKGGEIHASLRRSRPQGRSRVGEPVKGPPANFGKLSLTGEALRPAQFSFECEAEENCSKQQSKFFSGEEEILPPRQSYQGR